MTGPAPSGTQHISCGGCWLLEGEHLPARRPYFRQGQSLLSHAEATLDGWRKTFLQPFPSRAGGKRCAGRDSIHLISLLEGPRPSPNPESQKWRGRKQKWVWSSRRCWTKHDGAAELCCHPREWPREGCGHLAVSWGAGGHPSGTTPAGSQLPRTVLLAKGEPARPDSC